MFTDRAFLIVCRPGGGVTGELLTLPRPSNAVRCRPSLQADGSCSSADVAAEQPESERLAVNLAVGQQESHARRPVIQRRRAAAAVSQGLGKVPECLVHGLVTPRRMRGRVPSRALRRKAAAMLRALLSVDRFNELASSGDMHAILLNAVAIQQPQRLAQPRRRGRVTRNGQATAKRTVEWGLPHRGRISPEEAAYVREHLDEVQQLRAARGVPLLDPGDPKTKERYGL
jgi:hypothetical protein